MSKNCIRCGKDLSKWNLDFSRDIICDDCTISRLVNISSLEKKMKTDFKNTQDFNEKVGMFGVESKRKYHPGTKLREIRKAKGLSQKIMALELGCSERHLKRMESGCVPLNKAALKLFRLQG
jgi:DNA-binding transcriptional regulator YiaG